MKTLSLATTIVSGGSLLRGLQHEQIAAHCRAIQGRLLDLGSGSASYGKFFPPGCQVETSDAAAGNGAMHVFDANEPFPLPSETYDAVLCLNLLEHLCNPETTMREIYRILRKGGTCFLSTPFLYHYHIEDHYGDYHRYTHERMRQMFERAGFSPDSVHVERLGGQLGVILEALAQLPWGPLRPVPVLLRLPYLLLRFFDDNVIPRVSRRGRSRGKIFYLGLFVVARK